MNITMIVAATVSGFVSGFVAVRLKVLLTQWVSEPGGHLSAYRKAAVYSWLCILGILVTAILTLFHRPYWWPAFCGFSVLFGINRDDMRKHRRAISIDSQSDGSNLETIALPFGISIAVDHTSGISTMTVPVDGEDSEYGSAIDGVTTLILSLHMAGVNIRTPEFQTGVEDAMMKIADRH